MRKFRECRQLAADIDVKGIIYSISIRLYYVYTCYEAWTMNLKNWHHFYNFFSNFFYIEKFSGKMMPLETNRRILILFCLYPFDKNTRPHLKLLYTIFSLSIFLINVCALVSSTVFFFKFLSINLEESFYSLFQITGIFGVICLVINAYFSRNKILEIFNGLTDIYDACKCS